MTLRLSRFHEFNDSTIGILSIEDKPFCFTLEDAYHEKKIFGKTRIPSGEYKIMIHTYGRLHAKYAAKYNDHVGMLLLENVKDFEGVMIHCGNYNGDTEGCILVGNQYSFDKNYILESEKSYRRLYQMVIDSALKDSLKIIIKDVL